MHTNAKFDLANHGLNYPIQNTSVGATATAVPSTQYDVENIGVL